MTCLFPPHFNILGLADPEHFMNFEKCLSSMNSSEEICLLTTFAQMAQARRTNVDEDFIKIIVLEIYEVRILSFRNELKTFSFGCPSIDSFGIALKTCDSLILSALVEEDGL